MGPGDPGGPGSPVITVVVPGSPGSPFSPFWTLEPRDCPESNKNKTVNLHSLSYAKVHTRNVNAFLKSIDILPTFDSV